jgi:hypothetical protein
MSEANDELAVAISEYYKAQALYTRAQKHVFATLRKWGLISLKTIVEYGNEATIVYVDDDGDLIIESTYRAIDMHDSACLPAVKEVCR